MKILVIIVTYNAMRWIDRCLNSLKTSSVHTDVYIVDNGSTDGTQDYIKLYYPEFIFFQCPNNSGFGKGNNYGLQYAIDNNYDFVYLLNQDAWIYPDTLQKLIVLSKKYPEYGILSPLQMEANIEHLDHNFADNVTMTNRHFLDNLLLGYMKDVYDVPYIMAAHWFIPRICLLKVGGFSPVFPHYGEDNNYCHRVLYHNLHIGIVPSAKAVHDREMRKEPKKKILYKRSYINLLIYFSQIGVNTYEKNVWLESIMAPIVKFKSLVPLFNLCKFFYQWRLIKKLKEQSKGEMAFLKSFKNELK